LKMPLDAEKSQALVELRSHGYGTVHSDCVTLHGSWILKGLRGVGTIRQDNASIGMGGPLYDHGYEFSLDTKASTAVTNVWQLNYTAGKRESKTVRHLLTIHMDSARQLSDGDLLSLKQQASAIEPAKQ